MQNPHSLLGLVILVMPLQSVPVRSVPLPLCPCLTPLPRPQSIFLPPAPVSNIFLLFLEETFRVKLHLKALQCTVAVSRVAAGGAAVPPNIRLLQENRSRDEHLCILPTAFLFVLCITVPSNCSLSKSLLRPNFSHQRSATSSSPLLLSHRPVLLSSSPSSPSSSSSQLHKNSIQCSFHKSLHFSVVQCWELNCFVKEDSAHTDGGQEKIVLSTIFSLLK